MNQTSRNTAITRNTHTVATPPKLISAVTETQKT